MRWLPLALIIPMLLGCGTAPGSLVATGAKVRAAAAHTGALEITEPLFQRYNAQLDRTLCGLARGTITSDGLLALGPTANRAAINEQINRQFYAPLFGDRTVMNQSQSLVVEWRNTDSRADYQEQHRAAWERVAAGLAPRTDRERQFAAVKGTRRARWQRLSERIGIPMPRQFRLFRGVKGDFMAETVYEAWKDERHTTFDLPLHTLSSWTMSPEAAFGFREKSEGDEPYLVFEAIVPFEKTLLDKWVDGSSFVLDNPGQNEMVVATREEDELTVYDDQVTVWLGDRRYTYAERQEFLAAWERRSD